MGAELKVSISEEQLRSPPVSAAILEADGEEDGEFDLLAMLGSAPPPQSSKPPASPSAAGFPKSPSSAGISISNPELLRERSRSNSITPDPASPVKVARKGSMDQDGLAKSLSSLALSKGKLTMSTASVSQIKKVDDVYSGYLRTSINGKQEDCFVRVDDVGMHVLDSKPSECNGQARNRKRTWKSI